MRARRHDATVAEGENKEHFGRRFDCRGCVCCRIEIGLHLRGKFFAFRLRAERLCGRLDLGDDSSPVIGFRDDGNRHAGGVDDLTRFGRTVAFERDDEIGVHRQHAFRRELADIADIGKLFRGVRIDARLVACDQSVLLAERVDDLGDRATDRDDAARLVLRRSGGDERGEARRQRERTTGSADNGDGRHLMPPCARRRGAGSP